jgi:drug/metabolite transporter (DMT)-like permease
MSMNPHFRQSIVNVALLVVVNACWGMQFTAYKLVEPGIGPFTTSFLIYLIATPTLLPFYLNQRRKGAVPRVPAAERSLLRWNIAVRFLLIGSVAALSPFFMAWGMAHTTASNGALLSLTVPIVTALLAAVFLSEPMTLAKWACLAVAILGVVILSMQPSQAATREGLAIDWRNLGLMSKGFILGNVLVLGAYVSSALFNILLKSLLDRFSTMEILMCSYAVALLVDVAMLLSFETSSVSVVFAHSLRTWAGLILLGMVAQGLTMALWLFLLTRMDVSQASVSIYLMPFFGILYATVFLREPIALPMVLGGAVTLTGTFLMVFTESRISKSPQPPSR